MPTMPFGKHKGVPLNKIPRGYLGWILTNLTLNPNLKRDIEAIYKGKPLPETPPTLEQRMGRE